MANWGKIKRAAARRRSPGYGEVEDVVHALLVSNSVIGGGEGLSVVGIYRKRYEAEKVAEEHNQLFRKPYWFTQSVPVYTLEEREPR